MLVNNATLTSERASARTTRVIVTFLKAVFGLSLRKGKIRSENGGESQRERKIDFCRWTKKYTEMEIKRKMISIMVECGAERGINTWR